MYIVLTSFQDLIDHGIDYIGANVSGEAARTAKRAALDAYREMPNEHNWSYYYTRGRLNTSATYSTGTIAYTNSTRQVTLTSGTWPSWASYGTLLIANIVYQVDSVQSSTVLTLDSVSNPGADVTAGTAYTLYRDTYTLPIDFIASDEWINVSYVLPMEYCHPNAWLARQRLVRGPATPYIYTFTSDPKTRGAMAVRMYPPPDVVYNMDFIYKRRARPLVYASITDGTASVTSGATAVTGVGTNWNSNYIGSIIRFGSTPTQVPGGITASTAYVYEALITAVASTTSLTIDAAAPQDFSGVKTIISDPVDIEPGAMQTALLRGIEKQISRVRNMKDRNEVAQSYMQALIAAREADSRSFQRRIAGFDSPFRMRLAYMPRGADVS